MQSWFIIRENEYKVVKRSDVLQELLPRVRLIYVLQAHMVKQL